MGSNDFILCQNCGTARFEHNQLDDVIQQLECVQCGDTLRYKSN